MAGEAVIYIAEHDRRPDENAEDEQIGTAKALVDHPGNVLVRHEGGIMI